MKGTKITVTVNGEKVEAESGTLVLDLLRGLDLDIPTLCHDDRLTPYGGCRLCVVERKDGRGGLIPACSTPVQRGMIIETESAEVITSRQRNLQLLVLNHRMECPVCDRHGDCRFQDLLYLYGVPEERLDFELIHHRRDENSPMIVRDPEKCVLCGKCVRLCDEVQGVSEIGLVNRGLDAVVTTMLDRPLNCEFCGQCVNACPVGALIVKTDPAEVPPWLRHHRRTVCSLCSCGCVLDVELFNGKIRRVASSTGSGANEGTICAKGWLGWDLLSSPERLGEPELRIDGHLEKCSWSEALTAIAEAVRRTRSEGRAVAATATPRLMNEDALLLRAFIEGLESPWLSLGPEAGVRALLEGVEPVFDAPCSSASLEDIKRADLVLVFRGDPGRTHPLLKNLLIRREKQHELPFALVASFTGGLERHARPFLRPAPGTETAILYFLARSLAEKNLLDREIEGYEEWATSLRQCSPAWAAKICGLPESLLDRLEKAVVSAEKIVITVVTGRGLPGDEAETARAAASLAAALGDRAKLLVLGEKANLQGCLHAGTARKTPSELLRAAGRGDIGCLFLLGQDPLGAWPCDLPAREALEGAGFVVVLDAFRTPSARVADVVLPTAILLERTGSGIGPDGKLRRYQRVVDPPPGVYGDGEILRKLADHVGVPLPLKADIEKEAAALADCRPRRPRLGPSPPLTPPPDPQGLLVDPAPELFHSGSITMHSRRLKELSSGISARISPRDAAEAGITDGDAVHLVSGNREILLRASIDNRIDPGTVSVPWHSRNDGASRLIGQDDRAIWVHLRRS